MKEHMRYKADTNPPRSTMQNISLCFLISISAAILKLMLKITSISLQFFPPVILGSPYKEEEEEEEEEEGPLFTIHSFIPNLLHYYKVGDQASVKVEGVKEQVLIFSSSLTPGRVKGSGIVLI